MSIGSTAAEAEVIRNVGLKLNLRFITGRCVATRADARERPEWPPHPGRVYMALVAAHFETDGSDDDKSAERRALEWLAMLPAPRIKSLDCEERTSVTYFVPVNDAPSPISAMLQSAPGMPRSRQPRAFPTTIPVRPNGMHDTAPDVSFEWAPAADLDDHYPVLDELCRSVIRVGHSSSLVMAWAEKTDISIVADCWEPTNAGAEWTCRLAVAGEYERLKAACNADQIDLFARLKSEVESTSGKPQSIAKKRFEDTFGQPYKVSVKSPEPTPASLGVWQGYRRRPTDRSDLQMHIGTYFERNLLILEHYEGPALDVERTLGLTQALRMAVIAKHGDASIPAWLCGHNADGSPTSSPHAAFLSLPFAGHQYADGHLMGLAIAMPLGISPEERGRYLGPLLVNAQTGEAEIIKLWGSNLPEWKVRIEERPSPPTTLQNGTWTEPSTTWATVTPMVLDRFPKSSRSENRRLWQAEVIDIVKLACKRAGLPEPIEVDVDSTAWHRGVARAWTKTRRLHGNHDEQRTAPLGDGFPPLPSKDSRPTKPQVHVWLRFNRKVAGPVLIGAGRFLGYGLCKPVERREPAGT